MFTLHVLAMDGERQILGHDTLLVNDIDASLFESSAERSERFVLVEAGAVEQDDNG